MTGPLVGKKGKPAAGSPDTENPYDVSLRAATRPVSKVSSPKVPGDCYLLAVGQTMEATRVTFDHGLSLACQKAQQLVKLLQTRSRYSQ